MLHIREQHKVRRLCLTFPNAKDAQACYSQLARHVSVKQRPPSPASAEFYRSVAEEDEQVARWLADITRSSGARGNEAAEAAWNTNWPTERLVDMVKLCLTDPNFPGFVSQVQQCLGILTRKSDVIEQFAHNEAEE